LQDFDSRAKFDAGKARAAKAVGGRTAQTGTCAVADKGTTASNITTPYITKYRTVLCKHWLREEKCPYGADCSFAHGKTQLKKREALSVAPLTMADSP